MRNEVMIAGFGGQGVVKAATLLTWAAGIYEEKEVAQTQKHVSHCRVTQSQKNPNWPVQS